MSLLLQWCERVSPSFDWRLPHLDLIRAHLDRVTTGECKRLMVFLPPRSYKSETITVRYPVFRLEQDPRLNVIIGAYNQALAERFSRKARRLAEQRLALQTDRQAASEWETIAGGGVRAVGVGAGVTGVGGNLILVDDPVKSREEAESESYRDRVWDWFTDDLMTRQEPGAAVVLVMTRWHEDDLAGRLLREMEEGGEAWDVLRLPALAEENDPLGRPLGEPLTPGRFTKAWLEVQRRLLGRSFEALYQQNPVPPSGAFFDVDALEIVDELPPLKGKVRAWDLAATEAGGDFTAGVKMAAGTDGLFYVLDVRRGQWGPARADDEVKDTARQDGRETLIRGSEDPGAAGKRDAQAFVRMLAGWTVKTERVTGSKESRARAFASQVNAGNVRLLRGSWNRAFTAELRSFPRGQHDDQVDASADAFDELTSGPTEIDTSKELYDQFWTRSGQSGAFLFGESQR